MEKGFFITMEGGEGAGKSTQAMRLATRLTDLGHKVVRTREPGGSPDAEDIRDLLVNGAPERWSAQAETLLNYAARDSHLNDTIRPALRRGEIVICDRFMDSTRAYQGAAGGTDPALIKTLEKAIIKDTVPDLTLIFDIDPEIGLARADERAQMTENRFEQKPLSFHQTLRQTFVDLTQAEPERCILVDAAQDVETVDRQIWSIVEARLAKP